MFNFSHQMNQRVPSWDLEDVNPNHNHDIFKLGYEVAAVQKKGYEVAELTWEKGQVALHELGSRRVPTKSHPTASWDEPRAAETLEAIVNQATLHPSCKTHIDVTDGELVPWMNHHNATVVALNLNETAAVTSDALVPNSNDRTCDGSATAQESTKRASGGVCSTRVCSCSGNPPAFMDPTVARSGGGTSELHNGSSFRDISVSGTYVTADTFDGDFGGPRLTSTSTGSPENTSSGRDCSKSTVPDRTAGHRRTQGVVAKEKATEKKRKEAKSSISNKRRRTADIHNQSERKRRDKINQKLMTLQKMVPNSSKTDKASMLDEVIEYIAKLQAQLHTINMMNMSPMMMPLIMQQQQQQLQLQNALMKSMGMGMGMGGMDINTPAFMQMPPWNNHSMAADPLSAMLACRSQPFNMDSYSRMAALYQQMQSQQPGGPFPKM